MSTFINPSGHQPEPATSLDREALTVAAQDRGPAGGDCLAGVPC